MEEQPPLDFDHEPPDEPALPRLISGISEATWDTSATAAASVDDSKDTQRARVYEAIQHAGLDGCTDDELQQQLGLDGSSERPRRWELWRLARIEVRRDADGRAITRPTRTRRRAVVWVTAAAGALEAAS